MSMTLGDAVCMKVDSEWYQQHYAEKDSWPINESFLRKLMRQHGPARANRQYWIDFKDVDTLKRRVSGTSMDEEVLQIEEQVLVPFTLGLDWCSQLIRKQNGTQVTVIITVYKEPIAACIFAVY